MTTIEFQKTNKCPPTPVKLADANSALVIIISSGIKVPTLQCALGLLATEQTAPSDEVIETWLNEHRLEKYSL
ncbi:MAG: hypothetical protein ACOYNY_35130 [Caldilineaceae bacterium]